MLKVPHVTLACVYLARAAEGLEPARTFLSSYRQHAAGAEHTLLVIYKGWDADGLAAARALFAEVPHRPLLMDDQGFDIGSYLRCAREVADQFEYLCFLNTFSRIEVAGWLGKLAAAGADPAVGAAAATGSFESHADTARFLETLAFAQRYGTVPKAPPGRFGVDELHAMLLQKRPPQGLRKWVATPVRTLAARALYRAGLASEEKHHAKVFGSGGRREWTRSFGPFPNVHLRTNAFVIRTALLNSFNFSIPRTKYDAYQFESGPKGLSASIRAAGLDLRLVGADGVSYPPPSWPGSATFRSLGQQNLLVSDNLTRAYDQLPSEAKIAYQYLTWGSAMQASPPRFFVRFGVPFDARRVS